MRIDTDKPSNVAGLEAVTQCPCEGSTARSVQHPFRYSQTFVNSDDAGLENLPAFESGRAKYLDVGYRIEVPREDRFGGDIVGRPAERCPGDP